MLRGLLVFAFLLPLLVLTVASPLDYNAFFTRHDILSDINLKLDFGNQTNVYVNEFGEKELYFDSRHPTGYVDVIPIVGNSVLVDDPLLLRLNVSKPFNASNPLGNTAIFKTDFGHVPAARVEGHLSRNGVRITINYSVLSQECGGNYLVTFKAASALKPGKSEFVRLRFHIPCKADLLIVLSSLMGKPDQPAMRHLENYIALVANRSRTTRITVLSKEQLSYSGIASGLVVNAHFDLKTVKPSRVNLDEWFSSSVHSFGLPERTYFQLSNQVAIGPNAKPRNAPVLLLMSRGREVFRQPLEIAQDGRSYKYFVDTPNKEFEGEVEVSDYKMRDLKWYAVQLTLRNSRKVDTGFFLGNSCGFLSSQFEGAKFFSPDEYFEGGDDFNCQEFLDGLPEKGEAGVVEDTEIEVLGTGVVTWLDSADVKINGVLRTQSALNVVDQQKRGEKVKKTVAQLRKKHSPFYLLLIGSVEHIPMPFIDLMNSGGSFIPSDFLYVFNAEENRVEIPVARIPVALDSSSDWLFVSSVLSNIENASKNNYDGKEVSIIADACGDEDNCFIAEEAVAASIKFGQPCDSDNCLFSEPNCVANSSKFPQCIGTAAMKRQISGSKYVQVYEHGSGVAFLAENKSGKSMMAFSTLDISEAKKTSAIVSLSACYAGSIDRNAFGWPISEYTGTVFSFLSIGSPLVIANTRLGYGPGAKENGLFFLNNAMLEALANKDRRPASQIVVEKINNILRGKNSKWATRGAFAKQIYGDPLLPFYKPA